MSPWVGMSRVSSRRGCGSRRNNFSDCRRGCGSRRNNCADCRSGRGSRRNNCADCRSGRGSRRNNCADCRSGRGSRRNNCADCRRGCGTTRARTAAMGAPVKEPERVCGTVHLTVSIRWFIGLLVVYNHMHCMIELHCIISAASSRPTDGKAIVYAWRRSWSICH